MSSQSAPFATDDTSRSGGGGPQVRSGRRLYETGGEVKEAPFATNYLPPDPGNDGVGSASQRRSGVRRYGEHDHPDGDVPYAHAPRYQSHMWDKRNEQATASSRNIARKPADHGFMFRLDGDGGGEGGKEEAGPAPRSGVKRFTAKDDRAEAPFCLYMKGDVVSAGAGGGALPRQPQHGTNSGVHADLGDNKSGIHDSPFTRLY